MGKIRYLRRQWNVAFRGKENRTRGSRGYLDVMKAIHRRLQPKLYFEVGIRHGRSLSLAGGSAIGVDPAPEISVPIQQRVKIFAKTSDDFFAQDAHESLSRPIDLAFIDGMHLFEFALRDFINIERYCGAASLVVFDDVFPAHPLQAARSRETQVWTGDIWRIVDILKRFRPDLILVPIDARPTGLLLVAGLDKNSRSLADHYDWITSDSPGVAPRPPDYVLNRDGAWSPRDPRIDGLLDLLRESRQASRQVECRQRLESWRDRAGL